MGRLTPISQTIMPENVTTDKEHQRQQMSRVASGWIKLTKLTLDEYAKASGATRSNLFTQVADPEAGRRMSVEALIYSARIAGIRIDTDGVWWIYDKRAQTWHWEEMKETGKDSITKLLQVIKEECGSPKPFRVSRLPLVENNVFRMKREHSLVEIEDRQGNELTAILVADDIDQLNDAIETLLSTGLFEEMSPTTITPEFAMQVVNGACPKPQKAPDYASYDFNGWCNLGISCEMRGIKPQDIAKIMGIELPTVKGQQQSPAPQQVFLPGDPNDPPKAWNF